MEIDAKNSVVLHHFLVLAEDQGWNWVAFDPALNGQIDQLYGFPSAGEAIDFCNVRMNEFNYQQPQLLIVTMSLVNSKKYPAFLYTQYHPGNGQIKLLNDRLQEHDRQKLIY